MIKKKITAQQKQLVMKISFIGKGIALFTGKHKYIGLNMFTPNDIGLNVSSLWSMGHWFSYFLCT